MSKKPPSNLDRSRLAARVPPPPTQIIAQREAMLTARPTDSIDLWKLEQPALEYHADLCDIRDISGCPTLLFAAVDPLNTETVVNAIVISFPRRHFDLLWGSLANLRANIDARVQQRYKDVEPGRIGPGAALPQSSMRRYHCGAARIALNDDITMADFYSIAPYVKEQGELTRELMQSLVRPCIRIYMTPVVFQNLAALGDAFVGRGK